METQTELRSRLKVCRSASREYKCLLCLKRWESTCVVEHQINGETLGMLCQACCPIQKKQKELAA